jgi:UDP-N-acetylglucosamine acyltransferase
VPSQIHPTAIVSPKAELGEDVVIGPYCVIEDDVVIGDNTRLDPYVFVMSNTTLGRNNHVYSHTCLGGDPQHLVYKGQDCRVVIGDDNTIREFVTIHRGTEDHGRTTSVGNNCMLMAYCHIAHDCTIGNGVILANTVSLAGHVTVGDMATVGGITGVHQFVRLGEYSFLGAISGLGQDLPPFMLAAGSRATMHGLNTVGLKRHGFSREAISGLRTAYKRIFRSETPRKEALQTTQEELGHIDAVRTLLDFLSSSERGVVSAKVKTSHADE